MNNTQIAWTRTTFTSLWMGAVIYLFAKLGWELDVESPVTVLAIGLTGGVVWRVSELLANVPYLGYVLFGINKEPGYDQPTPPNPEVEAPAPDAGRSTLELIVLVVLVVLALFGLVHFFG